MHVTCEDCGTLVLITITTPRFDSTNSSAIREVLRDATRDNRDLYLVDFSKVEYLDSTGIGTLIGFVKYLGRSRRVELCGLSTMVQKIFRLTNLLSIFTIHDSIDDGLVAHRAMRQALEG